MTDLPERDLRLAREIAALRARVAELEESLAREIEAAKSLRASEDFFRKCLLSAHDAILLVSAETGDITHTNYAFEKLADRPLEVLRTYRLWEISPPDSRPSVQQTLEGAQDPLSPPPDGDPPDTFPLLLQRPDGTVIRTEARATRLAPDRPEAVARTDSQHILLICREVPSRGRPQGETVCREGILKETPSSVPRSLPTGHETVLVIDDDPMVSDVTSRMLQRLGYRVRLTEFGEKAVQAANSLDDPIHVALLDTGISPMDPERFVRRLREVRPGLPIVVCSSCMPELHSRALVEAGAVDFLQKPFRLDTLAEMLRTVLDSRPENALQTDKDNTL